MEMSEEEKRAPIITINAKWQAVFSEDIDKSNNCTFSEFDDGTRNEIFFLTIKGNVFYAKRPKLDDNHNINVLKLLRVIYSPNVNILYEKYIFISGNFITFKTFVKTSIIRDRYFWWKGWSIKSLVRELDSCSNVAEVIEWFRRKYLGTG